MSNAQIPLEPRLIDVLMELKRQILLEFNCAHLATIQEYDGSKRTCKATINYKKTFLKRKENGEYAPVLIDYPILVNVPVWGVRGGSGYLNMPINKGDQALIIFNDRDIANWYAGKLNGDLATNRLHSISDGVAFVGLINSSTTDSEFDATRVTLGNGETKVGISESKVKIENATFTLYTILSAFIDTLTSLTTTNCVVGNPVALSPTTISQLNDIKSDLGDLLE